MNKESLEAAALTQDLVEAGCLNEHDEMLVTRAAALRTIMQTVNFRFRARSAPGPVLLQRPPDSNTSHGLPVRLNRLQVKAAALIMIMMHCGKLKYNWSIGMPMGTY